MFQGTKCPLSYPAKVTSSWSGSQDQRGEGKTKVSWRQRKPGQLLGQPLPYSPQQLRSSAAKMVDGVQSRPSPTAGEHWWSDLREILQPSTSTSPSWRRSVLGVHWKDWCYSWSSNTLATWCEELTHWKRPSCWERLRTGGEGDNRGWDGWMASLTQWTWVWVDSGSWWWTGRPGVLQFMGLQSQTRRHWTEHLQL